MNGYEEFFDVGAGLAFYELFDVGLCPVDPKVLLKRLKVPPIGEVPAFWEELSLRNSWPPDEIFEGVAETYFGNDEIVSQKVIDHLKGLQILHHWWLGLQDDVF